MERRFDMSDFEQSLKDHADQFKMIPSKRVWNGIYNNLHPGSKWPSITVAIVFLITLITIGSLNNSTSHTNISTESDLKSPKNILQAKGAKITSQLIEQKKNSINFSKINVKNTTKKIKEEKVSSQNKSASVTNSLSANISPDKIIWQTQTDQHLGENAISLENPVTDLQPENIVTNKNAIGNKDAIVNKQINVISVLSQSENQQKDPQIAFNQKTELFTNNWAIPVSYKIISFPSSEFLTGKLIGVDKIEPVISNEIIILSGNTAAIKTNKLRRKKNSKIAWTFYVNPTISSVSFNKKSIQPSANSASMVVLSNQPSFKQTHNPRFGLETGGEMSLKIAKKFKFITGLNLSYSGYNNVSNLVHPTFANLTLKDDQGGTYSKSYITHYGNGQSQDHIYLTNYSVEASIPLGVQYNIWGNEKIKIDIASLVEPSLILKSNAFLISSDGRYYVNDPTLIRRTNLEGHFGSYITFIGKKIKWHFGPDLRYQLFSTYKSIYPTSEHLIYYGIRIGISK
jgi:hypothetical protein